MTILKVKFDNLTINQAVAQTIGLLGAGRKFEVNFLNADCLRISQKNPAYRDVLNCSELVLPDGVALKLAAWLFGLGKIHNCNGTDFSPELMRQAALKGYKIFLLGSAEGVAKQAGQKLQEQIPGIKIVGTHTGYFKDDAPVVNEINTSGADILFVAMGVPKQEKWIAANRSELNPKLCLGVGALLDYISGRVVRAPKIFRVLKIEWLWRVFMEPRRMFKRYFVDGFGFMFWLIWKRVFPRS